MQGKPRIMVTGAGGYIGRHVIAALAGKADIVPVTVNGARADLLDKAQRRQLFQPEPPDVLIHLAWVTEHGAFWSSPLNEAWLAASEDLFRLFYANGGRRLVATGSCAEYDWKTGADQFIETAPLAPHTDYGASKVRAMDALVRHADNAGGAWAWGRIFFSFGMGEPEKRLVPAMLRAAKTGETLGIGPGNTVRDFWPVETLGKSIAALALSDVEGPVNVASGQATTFADMARMIEATGARHGIIRPDSRPLGAGEPISLVADVSRLKDEVGFQEQPDLQVALQTYFNTLPSP